MYDLHRISARSFVYREDVQSPIYLRLDYTTIYGSIKRRGVEPGNPTESISHAAGRDRSSADLRRCRVRRYGLGDVNRVSSPKEPISVVARSRVPSPETDNALLPLSRAPRNSHPLD